MQQVTGARYCRRLFISAITATVSFCLGRPLLGVAAVDVGAAIKRSEEDAAALLNEIAKEPLPLSDDLAEQFLDRDFNLHLALATELSGVKDAELKPFIFPGALPLVEVTREYEVALVPAVHDFPRPQLKPSIPLPSPTDSSSPRLPDWADAAFDAVLAAIGYDQEERETIKKPFLMALEATPGGKERLAALLEAARLSDWVAVAAAGAGLIGILYFTREFIITFAKTLGRESGEAAAKRLVQKTIKLATLRFIPFVGPAFTTYRIVLALKLLIQRFR
jgi:hypothetical protein